MKLVKIIPLLQFLLLFHLALAEGTKELRPQQSNSGSLLIYNSYSPFAQFNAPVNNRLNLRISSLQETIYFGLNNRNGNHVVNGQNVTDDNGLFVPNVPFRIISPSGKVVYNSVIPGPGVEGNIATWTQAVNGPKELGNPNGYDAIELIPAEVGDYVIEFNPSALPPNQVNSAYRLAIDLFDFTVVTATNTIALGRLHSKGWQISTGSYTNPFNGIVYPYDGGNAVYKVDFNGMQPFVFVINFNSHGTANTGNFLEDRKSKIGNYALPEFEVFLNPPDSKLYPTYPKTIKLNTSIIRKDCIRNDFCIQFNTGDQGTVEGFIDLNNNDVYDQSSGELYFAQNTTATGFACIPWDGKDANGNLVEGGNFKVIATVGFGVTHLPLYDVEHNVNGYKIDIVRPTGSTKPLIYWDDSEIVDGTAMDAKVNTSGCSSFSAGCHKWKNRGSINNAALLNKQETISTWWYSNMLFDTSTFAIPIRNEVRLSFDPVKFDTLQRTVCRGDSLTYYIYNDGNHYNPGKFDYEWLFNGQTVATQVQGFAKLISGNEEIVIKATEKNDPVCYSFDTLKVKVVDPPKLNAVLSHETCNNSNASITLTATGGPPNLNFYWTEFPAIHSSSISNLKAGTFHVTAKDLNYSERCEADTSFTIFNGGFIFINHIDTTGTICYRTDGTAVIHMQDQTMTYEYSVDNKAFTSSSQLSSLSPGMHTVVVRNVNNGCLTSDNFEIPSLPLPVSLISNNEICNNGEGLIQINLPSSGFTITSNGKIENNLIDNLHQGNYDIKVSSNLYPLCNFDSTVTISNTSYNLNPDFNISYASPDSSLKNSNLILTNLSTVSDSVHWDFGDGQTASTFHATHNYDNQGEYVISLFVSDANGCHGVVEKTLKVSPPDQPCGIAMPNAFSPNGDEMNNDIGILGYAPQVELKIFNRWGEVIFRTFTIEYRWDGTYRGEEVPIGVYPFILDWECPDQNGTMLKSRRVGDITLVR